MILNILFSSKLNEQTEMRSSKEIAESKILHVTIGISGTFIAIITITIIILSTLFIQNETKLLHEEIKARSDVFEKQSSMIWIELVQIRYQNLRKIRQVKNSFSKIVDKCNQCVRLSCPVGQPGPTGAPGNDGVPGLPGKVGEPGRDGEEVTLEPMMELPCSICPSGPPGVRGLQGERGLLGETGQNGSPGLPGKEGNVGPFGMPGKPGLFGEKGKTGQQGPPGDNIIAGIGVKGPKGPRGSRGPKGPSGVAGRPSNIPGVVGEPGHPGPVGPYGKYGAYGAQGHWGLPGEAGIPAEYCPSDCGVSRIFAPFAFGFSTSNKYYDT